MNRDKLQEVTSTECSLSPEEGKRKVLQLKLSELVIVGAVEGSSLTIHFSSSLDILQAACAVYGHGKNTVGHGFFTQPLLDLFSCVTNITRY